MTDFTPKDGTNDCNAASMRERTLAVTWGPWGGIYHKGGGGCWRLCLGFVAITYVRAEMTQLLDAWLSKEGF